MRVINEYITFAIRVESIRHYRNPIVDDRFSQNYHPHFVHESWTLDNS
jgi:hypothetical protein